MAKKARKAGKTATKKVSPIPKGYHSVTPHLIVKGAAEALGFYQRAFGAQEVFRMPMPDGKVGHAEIKVGDSHIMLADEFPDYGALSPQSIGGSPVIIHVYVKDVDAVFDRAVKAGCTVEMALMDAFWGDRYGKLRDPFGHKWSLGTHKEDLTPKEVEKRQEAYFASMSAGKK